MEFASATLSSVNRHQKRGRTVSAKGSALFTSAEFVVTLHPGERAGDRSVHPRKRLQAENEGVAL
jgi:hypothetical protein